MEDDTHDRGVTRHQVNPTQKPVYEFLMMFDPMCREATDSPDLDQFFEMSYDRYTVVAQSEGEYIECFSLVRNTGHPKPVSYYFVTNGMPREEIEKFLARAKEGSESNAEEKPEKREETSTTSSDPEPS